MCKIRERFLNAHDAIHELIGNQVVPIVNENDAVATAEIKVGRQRQSVCPGSPAR